MSSLKRIEQETIINFNAGEQEATVYTSDKATMRKLDALVIEYPNVYKCIKVTSIDKTYSMPKQYVNYRKPRRISEERRAEIREQMRLINGN
ncbi:MAG: hypothetical protein IKW81_02555 [Pseudobutyrivibrio sp.]|nr:hypothetical protein [Pseudobutyrivibrio sp.]